MAETTFRVGWKDVGYEEAIDWQDDFLQEKDRYDKKTGFWRDLQSRAAALEQLVAFHLGLDPRRVECSASSCLQGGFNTALAVRIHDAPAAAAERRPDRRWPQEGHNVVLRLPTPVSCGETVYPGSILEKMRCEVAMYVWMQRHCPAIRIPFLYAFGFPDGRHFAHASSVPFIRRAWLRIRQTFATLCGRLVPSDYLPVTLPQSISPPTDTGYMLLEFLGPSVGTRLDLAVNPPNQPRSEPDPVKKRNLYRSFSRIMLSLARVPQPRIGAFRFNDDGTITLDNRPLVSALTILESEGAPRTIRPDQTFSRVDDYLGDMIDFHEQRFLAVPHAVVNRLDGQFQMGTWVFFRSLLRHFVNKERNAGPFVLQVSDKNECNFIVDKDWNVTAMFDLEFIVSAPVESMEVPRWLSGASLEDISSDGYEAYDAERSEFMRSFREEELHILGTETPSGARLSDMMDASWRSERLWVFVAVLSLNSFTHLAKHRFRPLFGSEELPKASSLFRFWRPGAEAVLAKKVADNDAYLAQVAALFGREKEEENGKSGDNGKVAE